MSTAQGINTKQSPLEHVYPQASNVDLLKGAETSLNHALEEAKDNTIIMESHLLLAKLYFYCANFHGTLHNIEQSRCVRARFSLLLVH